MADEVVLVWVAKVLAVVGGDDVHDIPVGGALSSFYEVRHHVVQVGDGGRVQLVDVLNVSSELVKTGREIDSVPSISKT